MSNAIYPTLAGLKFGVVRRPVWNTSKKTSVTGREFRAANMIYPSYQYKLSYEFLRDLRSGVDELRSLVGFFNARLGSFDSFLFSDPDDNTATLQSFGTGNGVANQFQLMRSFGASTDPVYDLASTPAIYKAGTLQSLTTHYTISSSGLVSFVTAPTAGQALTWSGTYYWRCRFETDQLDVEKFMHQLWQARTVDFRTVKP